MKKHWMTATALGALVALSLAACGSSDGDDSGTSSSAEATATATDATSTTETGLTQSGADADIAALESITWSGEGTDTALEFESPLTVTNSATLVKSEGDGDAIEADDNVTVSYTITSGTDGSAIYSTYDADSPETFQVVDGAIDPALYGVLVGGNVGATLLYATLDTSATVEEGEEAPAIFMALTVTGRSEVLERAEGTAVEPADGLPAVTLADDGAPSIDFTGADKSSELVVQTLIEGDGAEVTEGQSITANYTGWIWDGEQFDSSWEAGAPLSISLAPGSVIDGWTEGLVGQKVGSQVLLVIPPELGYGKDGSGDTIPGNSTLVFVVDILAAS